MTKKNFLAIVALLISVASFAQVELGAPKFSIKDGAKVNPSRTVISMTFPNVAGIEDPSTQFTIEGSFGEGYEFDGVGGSFGSGANISLVDFELEGGVDYTLTITSVKVNGVECAVEGGYTLNFKTRGERKMSWTFTIDEESSTVVKADADGEAKYWSYVKAGDAARFYSVKRSDEPLMLDDNTELPMTEDLTFNIGNQKLYVGSTFDTKYKSLIAFNANNMYMTIPDCEEGDVITFNANRATKPSSSKFTCIVAVDGAAIAPEGFESQSGVQDSIQLGSSYANFKFEVQQTGDVKFLFCNCLLKSINIEPGQEKVECTYNADAVYTPEEGDPIVLKRLVSEKKAMSQTTAKVPYSFWLADAEGNLYTNGTKGTEFIANFELKSDTTFLLSYKKSDISDIVYITEAEDIEEATLCTSGNAAIRSSNCKSAYVTEDTKLTTLAPGSYKIKAILFDAGKTPGSTVTFKVGEQEIVFTATATNWTEVESDLITVEEATDVVLVAGGSADHGLDVMFIYATDEMPDDPDNPDNVVVAKADNSNVVPVKVVEDNKILIKTAKGTFNAAGMQVK